MRKQICYFDCAATTPVDEEVLKAMRPYFSESFGNPGSLHFWGQKAQAAVDAARKKVADFFGVDFPGVLFFSSATEANNFAVQGIVKQMANGKWQMAKDLPHLVVSKVEHSSVLKTAAALEKSGLAEVSYLEVDGNGLVKLNQLKKILKKETVLVSVIYVNNETGAIQPIKEISKIIKDFRAEKLKLSNQAKFRPQDLQFPIFHTDAVQGLGHLPIRELMPQNLGVDLMTFSGHKIYGPKGIAVLVSRPLLASRQLLKPVFYGGSQEFGLRAGTENVPAIIGFAKAVELSFNGKSDAKDWRAQIVKKAKAVYPKAAVNFSETQAVPEIINLSFPGFSGEDLIYSFDRQGVAVSAGSACEAKALQSSAVLLAMGLPQERIDSAIRLSFGRKSQKQELLHLLRSFDKIFRR